MELEVVVTSEVVEVVPVSDFWGLLFRLKLPWSVVVPSITVVNVVVSPVVKVVVAVVVDWSLTPPWLPPLLPFSPGTLEEVAVLSVENVDVLDATDVDVLELVQVTRPLDLTQSPDVCVFTASAIGTSNTIVDSRLHEASAAAVTSNTNGLRIESPFTAR